MNATDLTATSAAAPAGVDPAAERDWLEVQRLAAAAQSPGVFRRLLAILVALTAFLGAGAAASGPRGSGLLAGALAPVRYLAVQVDASLTNR